MEEFKLEDSLDMQLEGARQILGIITAHEIDLDEEAFEDVMTHHPVCIAALSVAMGVLVSIEDYLKEIDADFRITEHLRELIEETVAQQGETQ